MALSRHRPLAERIGSFWAEPQPRRSRTWRELADINGAMLATCLAPGGYLGA